VAGDGSSWRASGRSTVCKENRDAPPARSACSAGSGTGGVLRLAAFGPTPSMTTEADSTKFQPTFLAGGCGSPRIACSSPASAARRSWCAPSVGGGYGPLLRPRRLIRGLRRAFSRGLRWLQRFSRSGPYQLTQTHVRAGSWPIATDVDAGATAGAAQHRVRPGRNFGLDSVWCANRTDAARVTAQGWEERDPLLCAKQWIPT